MRLEQWGWQMPESSEMCPNLRGKGEKDERTFPAFALACWVCGMRVVRAEWTEEDLRRVPHQIRDRWHANAAAAREKVSRYVPEHVDDML